MSLAEFPWKMAYLGGVVGFATCLLSMRHVQRALSSYGHPLLRLGIGFTMALFCALWPITLLWQLTFAQSFYRWYRRNTLIVNEAPCKVCGAKCEIERPKNAPRAFNIPSTWYLTRAGLACCVYCAEKVESSLPPLEKEPPPEQVLQ